MEYVLAPEEARLVEGLRNGDEAAFTALVREHGAAMLRVAQMYVSSRSVAEEVVADTWLAILNGIGRFEGRSSLKTWIFRILANTAKTRGVREERSIPFSTLGGEDDSKASLPEGRHDPVPGRRNGRRRRSLRNRGARAAETAAAPRTAIHGF